MVTPVGIEPTLAGSKPAVLPLDEGAKLLLISNYGFARKGHFVCFYSIVVFHSECLSAPWYS